MNRRLAACTALLAALLGPLPAGAQDHPSLLFSVEDEPALQSKIASGISQLAYQSMCPWIWWPEGDFAYGEGQCVEELGFRYRMSGDPTYAEQARSILNDMLGVEPSSFYNPNDMTQLGTAPVPIAMAYDLLYAELSPAERLAAVQRLEQYGELLYGFLAEGSRDALSSEVIAA
jgi:hypothetical protein